MLNQTNIKPFVGSKKTSKRLGRGNGSGKGTFSGKGCKGQNARKGSKFSPSFEGGQSPLFIRMPKMRGFTARNQIKYIAVNISTLAKLAEKSTEITKESFIEAGIIKNTVVPVKILADGEIKVAITVSADKVSKTAQEKIEKAGGKVTLV